MGTPQVSAKSLNRSPGGFLLKDAHHLHFTTAWLQTRGSWRDQNLADFVGPPKKGELHGPI